MNENNISNKNGFYCMEPCIEIQQLKAENEKLKKQLQEESDLGHKAVHEEADSFFEVLKYENVLDEIEEITKDKLNECCSIRNKDCDFSCNKCLLKTLDKISQLIKQAKEE